MIFAQLQVIGGVLQSLQVGGSWRLAPAEDLKN
jgi:hypothetical protein